MKVSELIKHLKQFDGELEVYAYCDHGQWPEKVSVPQEIFAEGAVHCLWDEWTSAVEDAVEYGYTAKAVLL